ncbi:AAA family ATPase [Acinetobacter piscicola]|uniref:AAA family ATPase n=1 Tax=Acinetobacter piscicola TaxID=2006115 RepID=UPI000B800EAE|nr:AAA family ATPase [Acinetobacter piscicola]
MTEKLYYWAENLEGYSSDNEKDYDQIIEIKRLNFFIGKNNAGKSRFLRNLFITKYNPENFYIFNLKNRVFTSFFELLNKAQFIKKTKDTYSSISHSLQPIDSRSNLSKIEWIKNNQNKSIIDSPFFKSNEIEILSNILSYSHHSQLSQDYEQNTDIKSEYYQAKKSFISDLKFVSKSYIPILRGMRPVTETENKQPYIERAQKDYFSDKEKYNSSNIITGECLYHELKIHLLGEPEQREIIKQYEEKLSQYFFDNEPITLIPKHDQDVVNIKIGSDKQFSISELGDGLQQVIILTYEAFIKKDKIHAFFIEEPELHMHAGMVRQLMNFYLNETKHYYFFTTHSNHLLDMADESDQVIIQKFVKDPKDGFDFRIHRCDRDRDLLASLGVKPSSVYLANCTIWVEGVTDRMYIAQYMKKYLLELLQTNNKTQEEIDEDLKKHKKYLGFMPNFHYAFVEYAGGNITHWSFMDDFATKEEALDFLENNQGLTAKAITQNILLLADGDNEPKADRLNEWKTELKEENVYILPCKEIENTLDPSIIYKTSLIKFQGISRTHQQITLHADTNSNLSTKGFNARTDTSEFDINQLTDSINYISDFGIGKIIDDVIRIDNTPKLNAQNEQIALPRLLSDKSGTIDDKVSFCEISKVLMRYENWQLTPTAKELCERIFQHIEKCNR